MRLLYQLATIYTLASILGGCTPNIQTSHVANGWAKNSVNTVVFRKHSLYTYQNTQYIGFYDNSGDLILGKRVIGSSQWDLQRTGYKGNAFDAHNSISLIVDQNGYLHVSWDQHNSYLRYARSLKPETLTLGKEEAMIGEHEKVVTYPEFHQLHNGDILFAYRSGESGKGDLILNRYDLSEEKWERIHSNLIDGEGQRNAYWQMTTDQQGVIHVSWVWRESADVASNHDMSYAKSIDGGITWMNSQNKPYELPITQSSAEVVCPIAQNSELINQTSMSTDNRGNPIIASYWKDSTDQAPQYKIIYKQNKQWKTYSLDFRSMDFTLSGVGTKAIPISRPQIVTSNNHAYLIFRDQERNSKVSVAKASLSDLSHWKVTDLTSESYASWEPTLDPVMWQQYGNLHLFLQNTIQIDGEGISNTAPTAIKVLEWSINKPNK